MRMITDRTIWRPFITLNLVVFGILMMGCKSSQKASTTRVKKSNQDISIFDNITKSNDINGLVKVMTGTFSTQSQAKADSNYFDITLNMYPIWTTKAEKYLYVEQAKSDNLDKPYRQGIYKLITDGNGGFESHIYTLENPELFVGKWATPAFFDSYDETLIKEKEGCAVYLIQHADGSFSGSTRLDHCKNTMDGASYATSIVKFRKDNVMNWDQGFDATGAQVWGTKTGGYRFVRVK